MEIDTLTLRRPVVEDINRLLAESRDNSQFCPVGRLEKIVVATDRSRFSDGAINEALNLAKKCSSKLYVISVLETNPEYETIGSNVFEREKAEAMAYLDSVKARAAEEGLHCETILHEAEDPSQAIVDEAGAKNADMIIVGRHGRTGLMKVLIFRRLPGSDTGTYWSPLTVRFRATLQ